uniref:DNA2/NAM7 helicase helicase domain-containing protein n=1 Tax=Acrobeloides nanus TaxID=290746 RepID=A0A914DIH5_9BILA
MPRGHFSHIIIDEAGQATEYDTWIPLGGLVGPNTKVVLSGDPKQLAPVVMVNLSKDYGSDISMLKRLSEMACYKNDG